MAKPSPEKACFLRLPRLLDNTQEKNLVHSKIAVLRTYAKGLRTNLISARASMGTREAPLPELIAREASSSTYGNAKGRLAGALMF